MTSTWKMLDKPVIIVRIKPLQAKRLQKLKLAGRDRMEQILAKHRRKEKMS